MTRTMTVSPKIVAGDFNSTKYSLNDRLMNEINNNTPY